jgi:guanine deaminase
MTLFRGTFLDTPDDPFSGGTLRVEQDGAVLVKDGVIVERGAGDDLGRRHPDDDVVDLRGGLVLPGFVDTHVHFPQARVIGALGMPLLDWLEMCALPEEAKLADTTYAEAVASDFVRSLAGAGTTTALVFGAHFAPAVDALFAEADRVGLRVTSGLVVSDRILRDDLFTSPTRAYDEGLALAGRWHGVRHNRYAVIPRFSLSCSDELLDSCGALLADVPDAWFTSHINENLAEITTVEGLFGDCEDYLNTYSKHELVGPRSVFAHNVHPTVRELTALAEAGASVAHCPTSNCALGSGLFPLREHLEQGVRVALGTDVGAGTGFSMLKEGLQAYFHQQLRGPAGVALTSTHLLHLVTSAGADALGLADTVGDFSVGQQFDAVWIRPPDGSALDMSVRHAHSAEDALAKAFAMGGSGDVGGVWIGGLPVDR